MQYVRVYADDDGESHFDDVTALMTAVESAPLAPPIHVSAFAPATAYGFLTAPPGWEDEWHPAPRRQIIFYLAGEVEAEASDGEVRRFGPGSIALIEDTTGQGHRSRVVGTQEACLAVVQLPG